MLRVPTDSNIFDAPSRLDIEKLVSEGVKQFEIEPAEIWKSVGNPFGKWGSEMATKWIPSVKTESIACALDDKRLVEG